MPSASGYMDIDPPRQKLLLFEEEEEEESAKVFAQGFFHPVQK